MNCIFMNWKSSLHFKSSATFRQISVFLPCFLLLAGSTSNIGIRGVKSLSRCSSFVDGPPTRRARQATATSKTFLAMSVTFSTSKSLRFIDIGANLLDERFTKGEYFGKVRHEPDLQEVLKRAAEQGIRALIVTAGTLEDSRRALQWVRTMRQELQSSTTIRLACTIGVHPTRCQQEFVDSESHTTADQVLQELQQLALDGIQDQAVVSLGEIGLDYDRLEFSPKQVQQEYFQKQLDIFAQAPELNDLPLFLHNRNVNRDLLTILQKQQRSYKGVVHSFDDTWELAQEITDMGLYIGLNGCSLKTKENLKVVQKIPLDKILLETDCPYCEIKPTHAGHEAIQTTFAKKQEKKFEMGTMVKGRSEPCQIIQVAEVIAQTKGVSVEQVAQQCYENTLKLYGWEDMQE